MDTALTPRELAIIEAQANATAKANKKQAAIGAFQLWLLGLFAAILGFILIGFLAMSSV